MPGLCTQTRCWLSGSETSSGDEMEGRGRLAPRRRLERGARPEASAESQLALDLVSPRLRGNSVVLMEQPAEHVAPADFARPGHPRHRLRGRNAQAEASVGALSVVMGDIAPEDHLVGADEAQAGSQCTLGARCPPSAPRTRSPAAP